MINYLLLILMSPIIILQGLYVRRVTPILPDPDGSRQGVQGSGMPISILIIGDSAALGVGVSNQELALSGQLVQFLSNDFEVRWRLIAETGDTTADAISKLSESSEEAYDIALISLGVNDVTSGISSTVWMRQQRALRDMLQTKFSVRHVISSGMPPMHAFPALPQPLRWVLGRRAREFDWTMQQELKQVTSAHYLGFGYLSDPDVMASDGFHPGEKIYRFWGQAAAKLIRGLRLNN